VLFVTNHSGSLGGVMAYPMKAHGAPSAVCGICATLSSTRGGTAAGVCAAATAGNSAAMINSKRSIEPPRRIRVRS
jgi:hypothetical protein